MLLRFILLTSLLALSINPSNACQCGLSSGTYNTISGPVITNNASTYDKGDFSIGFGHSFANSKEFSPAQLAGFNKQKAHTHSIDSFSQIFVNMAYGVTDDLTVWTSMPYNFAQGLQSTAGGSTIDDGDSVGFGDLNLVAQYRFYNSYPKHQIGECKMQSCSGNCSSCVRRHEPLIKNLELAVVAGIKMPTGQTNETNEFGFDLSSDHQPGSGSWDPLMGLAISKGLGRWSTHLSSMYQLSNKGSNDIIIGDNVNFNFALSYGINNEDPNFVEKIFPQTFFGHALNWSTSLEMNGLWQEKLEYQGIKDETHGGTTIYLSPGLNVVVDEFLSTSLSIGFPVMSWGSDLSPDDGISIFWTVNHVF